MAAPKRPSEYSKSENTKRLVFSNSGGTSRNTIYMVFANLRPLMEDNCTKLGEYHKDMKVCSEGSSASTDFIGAEPSSGDFLNDVYFIRGQSNGKEFRMAVSNKGRQSLVREGFMYRQDHAGKDKLSWRCCSKGCPAHLKTDLAVETIIQDNEKSHTHPADADKFERQLLRIACKRKAIEDCSTRAQDIICNEMTKLSSLNLNPKNTKFLQLAMYRERKKAFPKMPRITRGSKRLAKEEKKFGGHSDSVTTIPQPHIPSPPTDFYPQPTSAAFEPHFDMLTDDDGSDFQHHEPPPPHPPPQHHHHHQQHQPHHHHHQTSHHQLHRSHDSSSLHPLPQHLHQQPHSVPIQPPPPTQHLHQQQLLPQPQQQQHLESSLPHMLFSSNHLLPGPLVVASTSGDGTGSTNQYSSCALQKKICYADIRSYEDVLNDKVGMLAYRRALQENRARLKNATVLDIGAGTGILSHFAVQAGASKVYAIEGSSIAAFADKITKENGIGSSITVLQCNIENAEIPVKVDAIVSEWMGHNLLYESKLPSVLVARDRFLKEGGEIFPCSASLFLAPVADTEFQDRLKSWKQMKSLYGVSMDSLATLTKDALTVRADSRHLEVESVLANANLLCQFDLKTMRLEDAQQIKADFSFKCYGQNTMHGFATWFVVSFPGSVTIDTSPYALKTHWGQTVLYLKMPLHVKQDAEIRGTYKMHPAAENPKFWDIEIEFQINRGKKYTQQWQYAD